MAWVQPIRSSPSMHVLCLQEQGQVSTLHRHFIINPDYYSSHLQNLNMGRQKVYLDKMAQTFRLRNLLLRQALAECLGTLILVVSVCCHEVFVNCQLMP